TDVSAAAPGSAVDDPQEYLATKWVDSDELQRLNVPYNKGPFSRAERDQIDAAIGSYQEEHGLTNDQVVDLILMKQQTARAVPMRPLRSVFNHVRRARAPLGRRGKWSTLANKGLEQAVQEHDRKWDKVAIAVGRTPEDARAHFVTKVEHSERKSGPWSVDEETQFLTVVQDLASEGASSRRMNHSRTTRQCKHKWDAQLRARVVGWRQGACVDRGGQLVLWMMNLPIDWNSLRDEAWNAWSPLVLRKKWGALKARVSVRGATHKDIVRELAQQIVLPSAPLP
ncbi:hypothetical protein BC834DRAFT_911326, partial [Gloeopeniophorella convolvens]